MNKYIYICIYIYIDTYLHFTHLHLSFGNSVQHKRCCSLPFGAVKQQIRLNEILPRLAEIARNSRPSTPNPKPSRALNLINAKH